MNILKKILIISLIAYYPINAVAQSAPITIDGNIADWDYWGSDLTLFNDTVDDTVSGVEIKNIQVANDESSLFIRLKTNIEFGLHDNLSQHDICLYLDTDNDENTGFSVSSGFGAELKINFRESYAVYYGESNDSISLSQISLTSAPKEITNQYEIAISRSAVINDIHSLFTSSNIKLLFINDDNNNQTPNLQYTFSEVPFVATDVVKKNSNHIRILAYNVKLDGLIKWRLPFFEAIVPFINADIIGFSECHETTPEYVKEFLDAWSPLETPNGWYVTKHSDGDLITASHWPIIQSWDHLSRQYPALIDLPESYHTDLLFINAHLTPYTGNENIRQDEADQFIEFILDAKTEGGLVTLPKNTPFVYAGDLNIVGSGQPLQTILTGNIQNTAQYGSGGSPDWDNTDITDIEPRQTDLNAHYTWRNDKKEYDPGKLDFMICSDALINIEKSFVLQTEEMPAERLLLYGLERENTGKASDHFPVVSDFSINAYTGIAQNQISKHTAYPNPFTSKINITFSKAGSYLVVLTDLNGTMIYSEEIVSVQSTIDTEKLSPGVYFITIIDAIGNKEIHKLIKI
ncbi:MAG: T9SS type A sorting domain-containing protein [Bacteroidota bacterium]